MAAPVEAPKPVVTAAVVVEPSPTAHAEWRRNFVPAPLTALIGRHTEVSRVRDLLARSRLVTLTGPGGAGKSRLAIEVAHESGRMAIRYDLDARVNIPPPFIPPPPPEPTTPSASPAAAAPRPSSPPRRRSRCRGRRCAG